MLAKAAGALNVVVSGGGSHPFQHWPDRSIYESPRFHVVSELYGYLAKQFTVFGQHVHLGCTDGDQASTCFIHCPATCRTSSR